MEQDYEIIFYAMSRGTFPPRAHVQVGLLPAGICTGTLLTSADRKRPTNQ